MSMFWCDIDFYDIANDAMKRGVFFLWLIIEASRRMTHIYNSEPEQGDIARNVIPRLHCCLQIDCHTIPITIIFWYQLRHGTIDA